MLQSRLVLLILVFLVAILKPLNFTASRGVPLKISSLYYSHIVNPCFASISNPRIATDYEKMHYVIAWANWNLSMM